MKQRHACMLPVAMALLFAALNMPASTRVSADDPSPTPPLLLTAEPMTPAPTDTPTAMPYPTVSRERSTPVLSTALPTPTDTALPVVPTSTAAPARVPTTVIAAATAPVIIPTTTVSVEWPSAADLELNARLRWGKGVPSTVSRWAYLIVPTAKRYRVDPNLVAAVMTMESNGDPLAWSGADARGLMQVLHGPWDPRQNVETGVRMLASLHAEFGDWTLALAGYNAGPGAVVSAGGIPPYRETRDYVIVVSYLWDLYSHRKLTSIRKRLFSSTLHDLQHFKDQRRKVARLARIASISTPAVSASCHHQGCDSIASEALFPTLDPFWPVGTQPDPLQQVGSINPSHG